MMKCLVFCLLLHLFAPLIPAQTPLAKKSEPLTKAATGTPEKAQFERQWNEISQKYPLVARSHRQLEVSVLALISGAVVAEAKPLICRDVLPLSSTLATLWKRQCTQQPVVRPPSALSCFRSYLRCEMKASQIDAPAGCQDRYDQCMGPQH